jgi:shikimate dehydrogenase
MQEPHPPRLRSIDGETRILGLLGEGIAYTQSPKLHNLAAQILRINAVYVPLPLPAAAVPAFLGVAWQLGAMGFNVTTPHKALVASLVPGCKLASVNTLYRGADGWQAASTDGEGFARGLGRLGKTLADFDELVVLGSGGATTAVLAHVCEVAPPGPEITVLRRSPDRDAALRAALPKGTALSFAELSLPALTAALAGKSERTLLVQATSAPHRGDDLSELTPALKGFKGVVADLVYGKPSALYHAANALDLLAQDGEAMLVEQARLAQQLWWGKAAAYEELVPALRAR